MTSVVEFVVGLVWIAVGVMVAFIDLDRGDPPPPVFVGNFNPDAALDVTQVVVGR